MYSEASIWNGRNLVENVMSYATQSMLADPEKGRPFQPSASTYQIGTYWCVSLGNVKNLTLKIQSYKLAP